MSKVNVSSGGQCVCPPQLFFSGFFFSSNCRKIKINDLNREGLKTGVLRKSLKSWLYESDLRPYILGIVSSHISHGGEGAFYVYLKNNKTL